MTRSGRMTRVQAREQRKKLMADIAREHRRKEREKLAALRTQIAETKRQRAEALREATQLCRQERRDVKERAKERRRELLAELRELAKAERIDARTNCNARKTDIRQSGASQIQKTRALAREERAFQAELRRLERRAKDRHRETTTAHERRSESDDEVRANLPVEFVALFERVKRHIRGGPRQSRTEAMLKYVEEHPDEVFQAMQESSEKELAKLLAEEKRLAKMVRSPRRYKATTAELAAVPF